MAYEQKPNSASVFRNGRKSADNHPDMEGEFRLVCPHCEAESRGWLKMWRRQGKTGEWLSAVFKFRDRQQAQPQPTFQTPPNDKKPARPVVGRDDNDPFDWGAR